LYCAFIASIPGAAFAPRSMRRVSPTMTAPKPMLAKPSRAKTGYGNGRCEQG